MVRVYNGPYSIHIRWVWIKSEHFWWWNMHSKNWKEHQIFISFLMPSCLTKQKHHVIIIYVYNVLNTGNKLRWLWWCIELSLWYTKGWKVTEKHFKPLCEQQDPKPIKCYELHPGHWNWVKNKYFIGSNESQSSYAKIRKVENKSLFVPRLAMRRLCNFGYTNCFLILY